MTQQVNMLSLDGFASHANIVNYGTSKLACHLRRLTSNGGVENRAEEKPGRQLKKQELPPPAKRNENALNQSWAERRLDKGCFGYTGRSGCKTV